MKTVLSIAGFDPSGGAGILADMQTIAQIGGQGMAVISGITFQNESEVTGVQWLTFDEIDRQLNPLFSKYLIECVKVGAFPSLKLLAQVIHAVKDYHQHVQIIWDPVLKSSSGFEFMKLDDKELLEKILSDVMLLTPNLWELKAIEECLGEPINFLQLKCAVLAKGGHSDSLDSIDVLYQNGEQTRFEMPRISGFDKHGTGCVLSSAIATHISQGKALEEACRLAKAYVHEFLTTSNSLLGDHKLVKVC